MTLFFPSLRDRLTIGKFKPHPFPLPQSHFVGNSNSVFLKPLPCRGFRMSCKRYLIMVLKQLVILQIPERGSVRLVLDQKSQKLKTNFLAFQLKYLRKSLDIKFVISFRTKTIPEANI